MKITLLVLGSAFAFAGCAGVKVADTQVASGAAHPRAIYVRPFNVAQTEFTGSHAGGKGERPIRQSLAGREFADSLKLELEKMAPARVIECDERAPEGWVVEGSLDVVNAGSPFARGFPVFGHLGAGRSKFVAHVRVLDANGGVSDDKDANKLCRKGAVLYEFDLAGGSRATGRAGGVNASGLGYSAPFDYKNAAERVLIALSLDPHRYGARTSTGIR